MTQFTDQLRELAAFIENNKLPPPIRIGASINGLDEIQVSERDRAPWFNVLAGGNVTITTGLNPGTKRGTVPMRLAGQPVLVVALWNEDCTDPRCPHHGKEQP